MSAGSGASNLGYGNTPPFSNVNGQYVNADSSNWSGSFSSNQIPGPPGLAGTKSNIDAAAGIYPFKGGAKKLKRKIKNITKHYKRMKAGSRRVKRFKKSVKSRFTSRKISGGKKRTMRRRRQRGGNQYQNNQPFSLSYATGGILPPTLSMLANPVPISGVTNNAIDNYSRYTNMGFPSRGH